MAYTKRSAKHDRISIDGTDVSNCFRRFAVTGSKSTEDASGFSVTGVDETVPGGSAEGFNGDAFNAPELATLLWPLFKNDTEVEIQFQPNGLVEDSAPVWYGICTISEYSFDDSRGTVSTSPFTAITADEDGITMATGT